MRRTAQFKCTRCGHIETMGWGEGKSHECVTDRNDEPHDTTTQDPKVSPVPADSVGSEPVKLQPQQVVSADQKLGPGPRPV